ncbi:hypothetical protein ALC62_04994 [Cyphomyrmex costatus]|uniref:Uncharacterized protein n=1 Tax=Cyphomyrmex costatus TaxID=456900 RepID=A0A195CU70_9HYME|nr:hypothetical protein ALC62_04994 [Cyphomyrmex costatus]
MVRMLHAHRCNLDFEDTPMPSTNVQGGHLLNDQLSVSQRIIVRSGEKERCTAILVIALPTLRASKRVRHRRTDIDLLLTRRIVSSTSRETTLRFISAVLYRLTLLLFPPMRMVRRNVIGSQPDAMNKERRFISLGLNISRHSHVTCTSVLTRYANEISIIRDPFRSDILFLTIPSVLRYFRRPQKARIRQHNDLGDASLPSPMRLNGIIVGD